MVFRELLTALRENCVCQKEVMIQLPVRSSQKYPNGVVGPFELPSMALRLLLTLQSCLRLGVATLVTGKQGLAARLLSCRVPQGVGARTPLTICVGAA